MPIENEEDIEVARLLLLQSPIAFADLLAKADDEQLGLTWIVWLDRADALAKFAGNTRFAEVFLRFAVVAGIGVASIWAILGIKLAWIGLIPAGGVGWWWWMRRRSWHRATIQHVMWGALIADEYKQRTRFDHSALALDALENICGNVERFTRNYEAWTGRPLVT